MKNMKNKIKFDDFIKLDLRVGKITKVESIEGADKLYKLQVNFGKFKRQILSGIKEYYSESDLKGKQAVFIINLPPKKMRGEISEGMILCAEDNKDIIFISPERKIKNGSEVH